MYGVWQHGPAFLRGAQPWAVSASLSKLEEWAADNIPIGVGIGFFVESIGSSHNWSDTELKVVGQSYDDEVRFNGRPQQAEYYIGIRKTAIEQGCPKLTDEERDRQAVNVDAEVQAGQSPWRG